MELKFIRTWEEPAISVGTYNRVKQK